MSVVMYAVGCEIGDDGTRWASASRGSAAGTASDHGSLRSVVGVDHDGQLHAIDARPDPNAFTNHTTGFVNALGGSEPIIVAGTPYGAEALVAALLATVIQQSAPSPGSTPDAFAIVHDDDLDPFRVSLLVEAARLAGVPADRTVLVPRTDAIAGADDGDPASGAAAIALATLPDDDQPAGGAALAAGAAGLAAGGVIGVAATLGSDSTATAVAPTIGPAGTPLTGPTGTTLTGPAGTPITGPAGTPITGPAGTPITGPAGTPITGPAGTTLTGPAGTPITTGPQFPIPKPRPRWLPAAIASGTAVIVAVVTVTLVTNNNDTPTTDPTAAPASSVSESSVPSDASAPTTDDQATSESSSPTTAPGAPEFDTSAFVGQWQAVCEPYLPGDGASTGRYTIERIGPNQLNWTIDGVEFTNTDCSGEGTVAITFTYTLTITGETVVDGRAAYTAESDGEPYVLAVENDVLYLGEGSSFYPGDFTRR